MVENTGEARQAYRTANHQLRLLQTSPLSTNNDQMACAASDACIAAGQAIATALSPQLASSAGEDPPAGSDRPSTAGSSSSTHGNGYVLLNSYSFPRRVSITNCQVRPLQEKPVYVVKANDEAGVPRVVADAPALGIAVIRQQEMENDNPQDTRRRWSLPWKPARKSSPPMADGHELRNEFLEAQLDPATGGLRGLRTYGSRNNRLSQVLAFSFCGNDTVSASGGIKADPDGADTEHAPDPSPYSTTGTNTGTNTRASEETPTSTMVADSIRVTEADSLFGRIEVDGRLLDPQQNQLLKYSQSFQLSRGSRVLEIELRVHEVVEFGDHPWTNYLAIRTAWPNEAADLSRSLNDTRQPTSSKRFEAPLFVQIDDGSETDSTADVRLAIPSALGTADA